MHGDIYYATYYVKAMHVLIACCAGICKSDRCRQIAQLFTLTAPTSMLAEILYLYAQPNHIVFVDALHVLAVAL